MEVEEFVKNLMMQHLEITDEQAFSSSLDMYVCYGADQLDMIEISMTIEAEFDIEMPDEDYATADDFIKAAKYEMS